MASSRTHVWVGLVGVLFGGAAGAVATIVWSSHGHAALADDRRGIAHLHDEDVAATLTDNADELARLWDDQAVRIEPGRAAEIGKSVIYANDKQWQAKPDRERTLCYRAELADLRVAGDFAFEWGYFSFKAAAGDHAITGRGKVMRVLRRQRDGTWKFLAVMGEPEPAESAAPLAHPCE